MRNVIRSLARRVCGHSPDQSTPPPAAITPLNVEPPKASVIRARNKLHTYHAATREAGQRSLDRIVLARMEGGDAPLAEKEAELVRDIATLGASMLLEAYVKDAEMIPIAIEEYVALKAAQH